MAKCIRCNRGMCSFTLAAWGYCNHCGFSAQDMAEILAEMLEACKIAIDALGCDRTGQDRLEAQKIIHAAIAKAKIE